MFRGLVFLALSFNVIHVFAQASWQPLLGVPEKLTMYVDVNSVTTQSGYKIGLFRFVHHNVQSTILGVRYDTTEERWYGDCGNKKVAVYGQLFFRNGEMVDKLTLGHGVPRTFHNFDKGPMENMIYTALCTDFSKQSTKHHASDSGHVGDPTEEQAKKRLFPFLTTATFEMNNMRNMGNASFSQNVEMTGGKCGYVDASGHIAINPMFDYVGVFHNGRAVIGTGSFRRASTIGTGDRKYGYIDENGSVIVPPKFDWAYPFTDNVGIVNKGSKWGIIDRSGKLVVPLTYDEILPINEGSEGLVAVKVDRKWGYIDRRGTVKLPSVYEYASSFYHGKAIVSTDGSRYFLIDKSGRRISAKFRSASAPELGDEFIHVSENTDGHKKIGLADLTGEIVTPPQFGRIRWFADGRALVQFPQEFFFHAGSQTDVTYIASILTR